MDFHSGPKGGFAAVAEWMALDPDSETFVVRRFDDLSARNLLLLQCELLSFRKKLDDFDRKVARLDADMDLKDAAMTWETLVSQNEAGNRDAQQYMGILVGLRLKIKQYHEALVLQSKVAALGHPSARVLEASRDWVNGGSRLRPDGTKLLPRLGGLAKNYLDEEGDLAAIKSHLDTDLLSRALRRVWPVNEDAVPEGLHRIGRFEERSISRAVSIISTTVAAVLLLGSITALYLVENPLTKLLLIYAFTAAFALSVGVMTNARRVEIFAATAAYAAILVVFVSNGGISGSQTAAPPGVAA